MNQNLTVYIDESGNSGEVFVNLETIKHFHNQPYFVLAGIGIANMDAKEIEGEILRLKSAYKINSSELKASKLFKKPKFILDLFEYLERKNCPFFVELMDKKFYLAIQVVDYFIFPPPTLSMMPANVQKIWLKTKPQLANYIYENFSDSLFTNLCEAYSHYDKHYFEKILDSFIEELKQKKDEESEAILGHTIKTKEEYEELAAKKDLPREAFTYFLRLPDRFEVKEVSLLPHVEALFNLCARVEQYRYDKNLSPVKFIHDEQKAYENIFKDCFDNMKQFNIGIFELQPFFDKSKFQLAKDNRLEFANSNASIFIQIADLLSGFVLRSWAEFFENGYLPQEQLMIWNILATNNQRHRSLGVNMVVSKSNAESFFKQH